MNKIKSLQYLEECLLKIRQMSSDEICLQEERTGANIVLSSESIDKYDFDVLFSSTYSSYDMNFIGGQYSKDTKDNDDKPMPNSILNTIYYAA